MQLPEEIQVKQSESWRKNLFIIAIAEFIVLLGFAMFTPFLPLYMQKLGGLNTEEAAFWAGIATGGAGVAMFISSPIWGMIADRWGRKPMLLRAQIGGAVVVCLFILAPSIYYLVGFRILQGLFTGTVAAASALIASMTPKDKLPYSMGILMAAVFGGQTLGPLTGGYLADTFGFSITFAITAILLATGGLIILFWTKETFVRPEKGQSTSAGGLVRIAFSEEVFPLLLVIAALGVGPQILSPILPLEIGNLSHAARASTSAGAAFGLMGIITAVSSLVFGRIHGRFPVKVILSLSCVGTGLLFLPPIWANTSTQLIVLIGITGLFNGGIITSSNSLVGTAVPKTQQGIAYGLSQSASSLGSGLGPFIGGSLAPLIGMRPVFGVTAGIMMLVGLLSYRTLRK